MGPTPLDKGGRSYAQGLCITELHDRICKVQVGVSTIRSPFAAAATPRHSRGPRPSDCGSPDPAAPVRGGRVRVPPRRVGSLPGSGRPASRARGRRWRPSPDRDPTPGACEDGPPRASTVGLQPLPVSRDETDAATTVGPMRPCPRSTLGRTFGPVSRSNAHHAHGLQLRSSRRPRSGPGDAGAHAERYFADDANTALIKTRQFAERLTLVVVAERSGVEVTGGERTLLRRASPSARQFDRS